MKTKFRREKKSGMNEINSQLLAQVVQGVRCCEQNECISIEQLYIKPRRVEQSIDEYTGRVAMASHPPFSLC